MLANEKFIIELVLGDQELWVFDLLLLTVCVEITRIPCFPIQEHLYSTKQPTTFHPHTSFLAPFYIPSNKFMAVLLCSFHEFFQLFIHFINSHNELGLCKSVKVVAYPEEFVIQEVLIGKLNKDRIIFAMDLVGITIKQLSCRW
jgi:hypothetical protein